MLFHFELLPVRDISPWGEGRGPHSWYALTLGWYWWRVGDTELFRYSDAFLEKHGMAPPHTPTRPHDDYQLARPWEDLLVRLPAILNPVPDDIAAKLMSGSAWINKILDDPSAGDIGDEMREVATRWWLERTWDAMYLKDPPRIWLWTDAEGVHIRWDNGNQLRDGVPMWDAEAGEVVMPAEAFVREVVSFDARLLRAMEARIATIPQDLAPGVRVDVEALSRDQEYRRGLLSGWLAQKEQVNWDDVREALNFMTRPGGLAS